MMTLRVSLVFLATKLTVMSAQNAPAIESSGPDINVQALGGQVNIMSNECVTSSSELCSMKSSMSTVMSTLKVLKDGQDDLNAALKNTQTMLNQTRKMLAINPDPTDDSPEGGYTNTIMQRIYQRPTWDQTDRRYMTIKNATMMFADKSESMDVAQNQIQIQQNLANFSKEVRDAISNITNSSKFSGIPLCDPYPVFQNGVVADQVEHVPGTIVELSCKNTYKLEGSDTARCLSNTSWLVEETPSCKKCDVDWLDTPCALRDWREIQGGASLTSIDIRTGNPGGQTSARYPDVVANGGVYGIKFSFQYVTGYGQLGSTRQAPYMYVYLVDADDKTKQVEVWNSKKAGRSMDGFPYDQCNQNGGWGDNNNPNDGCYSKRIQVSIDQNTPIMNAETVYVLWKWENNERNLHINDDGINMQMKTLKC